MKKFISLLGMIGVLLIAGCVATPYYGAPVSGSIGIRSGGVSIGA